ncbi:MAG: glycoside hydrolase family 25 protein [Clostridia bacterium]|nr:glycoside hydrolase family 25 protein [Clostridia bacterium]
MTESLPIFGVDVSTWQTDCDYEIAAREGGVKFAMIRAGFGKNAATQKDNMFETHYAGFLRAGVPMGAYQYSYAKSPEDAVREAEAFLGWIAGKELDLPCFLDMEEASVAALGKKTCTEIALSWCARVRSAGYTAGIYTNPNWLEHYLDADTIGKEYRIWCASWGTKKPEYEGLVMWQFGGQTNLLRERTVPGIGDIVDQNFYYGGLEEKPVEDAEREPRVGDTVDFTGNIHFAHANARFGPRCLPGKAKITQIARGYRHPYHLVRVWGEGSTVYGWVDREDFTLTD